MITYSFDPEYVGRWVCEKAGGVYHTQTSAIGLEVDGKLVIGMYYTDFTGSCISMHSRCDDPKAGTRRFLWMMFDYPFNQLGVKRIIGYVSTANKESQEADEHIGFTRETIIRDYFPDGDAIVYEMRKENCPYLKLGKRYAEQ